MLVGIMLEKKVLFIFIQGLVGSQPVTEIKLGFENVNGAIESI